MDQDHITNNIWGFIFLIILGCFLIIGYRFTKLENKYIQCINKVKYLQQQNSITIEQINDLYIRINEFTTELDTFNKDFERFAENKTNFIISEREVYTQDYKRLKNYNESLQNQIDELSQEHKINIEQVNKNWRCNYLSLSDRLIRWQNLVLEQIKKISIQIKNLEDKQGKNKNISTDFKCHSEKIQ